MRTRPLPRRPLTIDGNANRSRSRSRMEPAGAVSRPTGMLTVNLRRAAPAVVLAATLTMGAACGADSPRSTSGSTTTDEAPPSPTAPTGTPPTTPPTTAPTSATGQPTGGGSATPTDGTVASRVVYFSSSVRATAGLHEVLHDRGELDRFAGAVAARDADAAAKISAGGRATDFSHYVLVGWTRSTGCSAATSATLTVSGSTLRLRVSQPDPPPECLVDYRVTVLFEVPKERIPARPAFS